MKVLAHIGSLLFCTLLSPAEPVTLKSNDGSAISATVIGFDGKEITIVKQNGLNTRIPIERLDDASKKIVADEIKKLIAIDERTPAWRSGSNEQKEHTAAPQYSKADISNAYYTSRAFIKKALKAPETAKFSNPLLNQDTTASVVTHEGRIRSTGVVEAQNSFGVPLEQSWQVVVQSEGNQWRVVYAVLGENTLIDTRKEHKTQNTMTAESFMGMTKQQMINKLGEPSETLYSSNAEDGKFSIYTYSKEKGKETLFTIWDSDEKITSGCYQGTYFSK
jgi:hypothetical protein